jgi:hypothetical protein
MRVVGTAGASAAANSARHPERAEHNVAALAPSFGAYSERLRVVHLTINEGPALGRARGNSSQLSESSRRTCVTKIKTNQT